MQRVATRLRAFVRPLIAPSWGIGAALLIALSAGDAGVASAKRKPAKPESASTPTPPERRDEGAGPLPWRVSGPAGFTVDAVSFPDSGGVSIDLYLRLPPPTLRGLLSDSTHSGHARIQAEMKSGYRARRQSAEQIVEVTPRDTSSELGEVVLLRFPAKFGPQSLKVRVDDLSPREAKLPRLGKPTRSASVSGEFDIAAARDGRLLSQPEFIWEESDSASGPFQRMGRTLIPNPERLYGLYETELHVAFAAVAREARPWHWRVRVLDERQAAAAAAESTADASTRLDAQARIDLSQLPAGGYDLELSAWQEGDPSPLRNSSRFSIAWQPETWNTSPGELQDIVHFLLSTDDEESFARLHPGEQERWLEGFWRRRDPTPGTAVNEMHDAFLKRVGMANERFGRAGLEPGMFSDMGRVFIRYGEPSEVEKQVIPTGDETLRQIIEELTYTENRDLGTSTPGLGGDMRPYEVWVYEGEIPVPIDADPERHNVRHKKLLFLFVDDRGIGDYRLRYSNE